MILTGDIVEWTYIDEVSDDQNIMSPDLMCKIDRVRGRVNRFTLENLDSPRQETQKDKI